MLSTIGKVVLYKPLYSVTFHHELTVVNQELVGLKNNTKTNVVPLIM